jgi:hypothetical protein
VFGVRSCRPVVTCVARVVAACLLVFLRLGCEWVRRLCGLDLVVVGFRSVFS